MSGFTDEVQNLMLSSNYVGGRVGLNEAFQTDAKA